MADTVVSTFFSTPPNLLLKPGAFGSTCNTPVSMSASTLGHVYLPSSIKHHALSIVFTYRMLKRRHREGLKSINAPNDERKTTEKRVELKKS